MKKKLLSGLVLCLCVVCFSMFFSGCKSKKSEVSLTQVVDAVKTAYGDNYAADMVLAEAEINEVLGISSDLYEEIVVETPMISVRADKFIAAKAVQGKVGELEKAITDYREKLVNDTLQYPMNVPMIKESKVVRHDDYVFFVLLGELPENVLESGDDSKMLAAAKEQIKIGTDAIDKAFK